MTDLFPLEQLDHVDSWQPINLNTLPDKPPIEPTLGNTGLLYPGKRHVFSGPPESAKTLAAYTMLILVARTGHTGILIDFEMGSRDAKQRLQELGATHDELAHIPYLEPDTPATPQRLGNLISLEPVLVVIDAAAGAYQAEGLDDNKRGDVERFSRLYVGAFWLAGIATIVIDHVVKSVEGRGKFAIGSERKLGSSDVHLGFDTIQPVSRGTTGRYKITTHKDRGGCLPRGHIADFHLESDPDTHQIAWKVASPEQTTAEAGYFRPTHLMEKVSIDLEHRAEPVSRNTIYDTIGGTKDYVLKAISALVTEGFIAEVDGERRTKLIHSTRRYRADDPTCNPETEGSGSVVRQWFGSGSEPLNPKSSGSAEQFGSGSTQNPLDTAENPPVPNQFGSGSASDMRAGSDGGSLRSKEPSEPATPRPPEPHGWFGANGNLLDAYFDEIAPDETELE
jgi:hypothetical protein